MYVIWVEGAQDVRPLAGSRDGPLVLKSLVWQRNVHKAIRALDTLDSPDYADVVITTVSERSGRSPEQWIRIAVQGLPSAFSRFIPVAQRLLLGLELRRSPDYLLGWKIADRGENWVRLEAASWLLTGHIIVHVDDGQLRFATLVRYDRPVAALVWPLVSLIHRQVAVALVRSAARSQT